MTPDNKPREFWILFRRWNTIVMDSKEDILKVDPKPVNPDVNLVRTVEHSAYAALEKKYQKAVAGLKLCAEITDDDGQQARQILLELGE